MTAAGGTTSRSPNIARDNSDARAFVGGSGPNNSSSSSANRSASDLGGCGVGSGSSVFTLFLSDTVSAEPDLFLGNPEGVGKPVIGCGEFMHLDSPEICSVPTDCCGSFCYVMSEICPLQIKKISGYTSPVDSSMIVRRDNLSMSCRKQFQDVR